MTNCPQNGFKIENICFAKISKKTNHISYGVDSDTNSLELEIDLQTKVIIETKDG